MAAVRKRLAAILGLSFFLGLTAEVDAQQQDLAAQFAALDWQAGPTQADLGDVAMITVPEGFQFVGRGGAGKFMELLENPSDGSELGVILNTQDKWFVVFEFSSEGYVEGRGSRARCRCDSEFNSSGNRTGEQGAA